MICRYTEQPSFSSSWVPSPASIPLSRTAIKSAFMTVETRWATMTVTASLTLPRMADRMAASVLKSSAEKESSNT